MMTANACMKFSTSYQLIEWIEKKIPQLSQSKGYISLAIVIQQKTETIIENANPVIKMSGELLSDEVIQSASYQNYLESNHPLKTHLAYLNGSNGSINECVSISSTQEKTFRVSFVIFLVYHFNDKETVLKSMCHQIIEALYEDNYNFINEDMGDDVNIIASVDLNDKVPSFPILKSSLFVKTKDLPEFFEEFSFAPISSGNGILQKKSFHHGLTTKTKTNSTYRAGNEKLDETKTGTSFTKVIFQKDLNF